MNQTERRDKRTRRKIRSLDQIGLYTIQPDVNRKYIFIYEFSYLFSEVETKSERIDVGILTTYSLLFCSELRREGVWR